MSILARRWTPATCRSFFPGNVQGRHIREPGAKGCVVVAVVDGRTTRTFHPLDVLRWATCRVDAAALTTADDVATAFGSELPSLLSDSDGRNLAVRVEIVGASPAHSSISATHSQVIADIQAAANDFGSGRVWVEKVRFLTRELVVGPAGYGGNFDGPLGVLDSILAELRGDPNKLAAFAQAELGDLRKKIPAELNGEETPDLGASEYLLALLGQVRPLLDARFQAARGAK